MRLPFVKMEGAGNDYVYVDGIAAPFPAERGPAVARFVADRHLGVGGDGLIVLAPGARAAVRMLMWNADGSRGAMCGNGLRCLAALARDRGHVDRDAFEVETDAGLAAVTVVRREGPNATVRIALPAASVRADAETIEVAGGPVRFHAGDAGNPHAVVFVAGDPERHPVATQGAAMQCHPRFPDGVNVEFVQVLPDGALRQRTWERGSGETMACGSGAAIAALCAVRIGAVPGPRVPVRLRGGELTVEVTPSGLVLEGPARTVFRGEIEVPEPGATDRAAGT